MVHFSLLMLLKNTKMVICHHLFHLSLERIHLKEAWFKQIFWEALAILGKISVFFMAHHEILSGKDEIIGGLNQIIYLEDTYKLYNEIDTAYNTPWSLFYDLTARVLTNYFLKPYSETVDML